MNPDDIKTLMERGELRRLLAVAYTQGALDVHSHWLINPGEAPRGDPEFEEAANDYATAALDPYSSAAQGPALESLAPAGVVVIAANCRHLRLAASPTVGTMSCINCQHARPMTREEFAYWNPSFEERSK